MLMAALRFLQMADALDEIPIARRPASRITEEDPFIVKRNRRMFGSLLGHLDGHRYAPKPIACL